MLNPIIKADKIKKIEELTRTANNIVITCHLAPDGDALGSSMALYHVLSAMGKKVHVVTPDLAPASLLFIPGVKEAVAATRHDEFARQLFKQADLIFCLDFNAPYRIDRLQDALESSTAPKVLIDHHLNPEVKADVTISHPEISSTCMLLFRVICQLGWLRLVDKKVASCIYTGMMTDTGNFSYNSQDPDLYIVIAELLRRGIDKDSLYKKAFNTKTINQLKINGYAIAERTEFYPEHGAALMILDKDDLEKYDYQPGATEGLVNVPLSVPEIKYVVFLRQADGYVKVSTRSEGDIPVNEMCSKYFNGGGHKNAAGGEFYGTMDEAVKMFEKAMADFDKYFNK